MTVRGDDSLPAILDRELRGARGERALVDDLLFFFRTRDSQAELVEEGVVGVAILHVLDDRQARLELDLYLRVGEALHPDAPVDLLRDG
jgi:hypothetical protein